MSTGEWPVPPDEQLVEPVLNGMTRRHSLYVLAGATVATALIGGGVIADEVITNDTWPPGETYIETVKGSRRRMRELGQPPETPWVAAGGLGRQNSLGPAEDLAYIALGVPKEPAMVGGLYVPNQGISAVEDADCIFQYAADGGSINVLGHSMGSLTIFDALLAMEEPLHVDNFILVSSPFGLDDVFRKGDVAWVVEHGLDGDAVEKFVFNILNDHSSQRPGFLGKMADILSRAAHHTTEGVSPMVYVDQLKIIYHANLMSKIGELAAKGIITPKTRVRYCKSPRDGTVIADQACNNFGRFFTDPRLGADFSVVTFDGGHADTQAACKVSTKWCQFTLPDFIQPKTPPL